MINFMYVFLGAGIGGAGRFFVQLFFDKFGYVFPLGTMIVNLVGCFIIGIAFGLQDLKTLSKTATVFFVTGILGGFTTFSSFSLETITLLQREHIGAAILNICISVFGGLILTYLGYRCIRPFVCG